MVVVAILSDSLVVFSKVITASVILTDEKADSVDSVDSVDKLVELLQSPQRNGQ